jgi:hypothetical protein
MDEMGREGRSTYILGPDGRFSDLKEFIDEIIKVTARIGEPLNKFDAKVRREEDVDSRLLLEELKEELKKLPRRVDEWKKRNDYALIAGEVISAIVKVGRRLMKFGKRVGDDEIKNRAKGLFKLVRRIYP